MAVTHWMQCDCCGRLTNRLHDCQAYGVDTAACDACCGYDHAAYDEPPALYLDAQSDPRENAYNARQSHCGDGP